VGKVVQKGCDSGTAAGVNSVCSKKKGYVEDLKGLSRTPPPFILNAISIASTKLKSQTMSLATWPGLIL
jgi:hypothetical protein